MPPKKTKKLKIKKGNGGADFVLHVGSFPPRECGIATFTQDITTAIEKKFNPALKTKILALNEDPTSIYNYSKKVTEQLPATELERYVDVAKKINRQRKIKIVNIQHEFGLFGGHWGNYLLPFLQVIEKPVVVTFHSVMPKPEPNLKKTVRLIAQKSKYVIVMNHISQQTLVNDYGVSKSKISFIPHGIPQVALEPSSITKETLNLKDKTVLSTFGLLSPGKGIEYAIRALPLIVKKYPDLIYLILGITHPLVRQADGESYRNFLHNEVKRLGLKNHVKFYNKYLTLDEIIRFLKATDIYICSSLEPKQSVSGSVSYALGCGRPVICTKSDYAKHIVNKDNGTLVNFKNSRDITKALDKILSRPKNLKEMSTAAYESTRQMTWPNVASSYFDLYNKITPVGIEENKLPEVKLDHLIRLTDNFGVLHFAKYSTPETKFGYSLDDNARALIVAADFYKLNPSPKIVKLMETYLRFIKFTQRPSGTFSNIVSYQKKRDGTTDEDVQGRAIWALASTAVKDLPDHITKETEAMFKKSIPILNKLKSPRAIAFAIDGLQTYLKHKPNKKPLKIFESLAEKQFEEYQKHHTKDWEWLEGHLTYSNSKLPESLYHAYDITKKKKYLSAAEKTLNFLSQITFEKNGRYSPIGQNGWYFRDKKRSYFDQQPEDTASMVQTKIIAYKTTKNRKHLKDAENTFQWFLGKNHLRQTVYDEVTGGCQDGVGEHAINLNQGAESTISYLLARLALETI